VRDADNEFYAARERAVDLGRVTARQRGLKYGCGQLRGQTYSPLDWDRIAG